ncbi:MAG: proton-conducting transporter membrane subunit [Actinomycetaceae bacterium]|nr:proton-conducting transporter membrane subunit [Actinomycetaceae bacterium]
MSTLALVYCGVALMAPLLFRYLRRAAFIVTALVPAAALAWAVGYAPVLFLEFSLQRTHTAPYLEWKWPWISSLEFDLIFRMDALSWLMVIVINVACALILIYCAAYFPPRALGLGRFNALFLGFAFSMNGLVLADHTMLLYVFWELTALFSYLLIGHHFTRRLARASARQAFLTTTMGSLAMFGGFFLLRYPSGGSFRISELVENMSAGVMDTTSPAVLTGVALIVMGACTKSAMIPFHFWLPAAMAAPTPVSAFLHAASMVKAGIFLLARMSPGFIHVPYFRICAVIGLATMIVGAYRALRQSDLKLILAYGTVSQLGFMLALAAWGSPATQLSAVLVLIAHASFKSSLFLTTGSVEKLMHTRDIFELNAVGKKHRVLATSAAVAAASMAGVPITAGYIGKESALHALLHSGWSGYIALFAVTIGSILTAAYSLRYWWGAFATKNLEKATPHKTISEPSVQLASVAPSSTVLVGIPVVLSLTTLGLGWLPRLIEKVAMPAALGGFIPTVPVMSHHVDKTGRTTTHHLPNTMGQAFTDSQAPVDLLDAPHIDSSAWNMHVSWWSGPIPAIVTALILIMGFMVFRQRIRIGLLQRQVAIPHKFSAANFYAASVRRLESYSAKVVSVIQRGSLPHDLMTILVTTLFAAGIAAAWGNVRINPHVWIADFWTQLSLAIIAIGGAAMAILARRRLTAAIALGVTGAAIAMVFLTFGGPDLALTQLVVEAVTLVIFVLVFRRLPRFFSDRPLRTTQMMRALIALVSGVGVILLGLVVTQARQHLPVSTLLPEEVKEFGQGDNIVNVILVDVRAWDTVGELTVLLVAALGVTSLIYMRAITIYINTSRRERRTHLAKRVRTQSERTRKRIAHKGLMSTGVMRSHTVSWLQGAKALPLEQRSVIMEVSVRVLFHTLMLVSIWVLLIGHNNPGGGFIAGMTAGIALTIRYIAGGRFELFDAAPYKPGIVLGLGLFIAACAGVTPVIAGQAPFQTMPIALDFGWAGHLHFTTAIFLDIGVYLVVMGVVLDILSSLGSEIDRQAESEGVAR